MNYKEKYDSIPSGYQCDVLTLVGCNRMGLTRFFSDNPNYHTSAKRRAKFESAINKIWKPHNLAKQIDVDLGTKIIADHPTATEYIEYRDLMSFKIQITGTIGDSETVYELIDSSKDEIERLHTANPYEIQLLIAKYILR